MHHPVDVIRRVGGLEVAKPHGERAQHVIRRVGGLEVLDERPSRPDALSAV